MNFLSEFRASHIVIVMVVLLMVLPAMVWGIDEETLQGIKGVGVVVEDINPEIEKNGLSTSQIQTDVELKLRMAGINVLTTEERLVAPGKPWLYVKTHVLKSSQMKAYVFVVNLKLLQEVYLVRNAQITSAPTWHVGAGGFGISPDLDVIRGVIKDSVDVFLNAWLSVNPKTEN